MTLTHKTIMFLSGTINKYSFQYKYGGGICAGETFSEVFSVALSVNDTEYRRHFFYDAHSTSRRTLP